MKDFKSILMTESIQDSLPKIKENLNINLDYPINRVIDPEKDRSRKIQNYLSSMKMEISEEIGLQEKLKEVNYDAGLLSPTEFGHLGGQMSKRLTETGKELYRRMCNE